MGRAQELNFIGEIKNVLCDIIKNRKLWPNCHSQSFENEFVRVLNL